MNTNYVKDFSVGDIVYDSEGRSYKILNIIGKEPVPATLVISAHSDSDGGYFIHVGDGEHQDPVYRNLVDSKRIITDRLASLVNDIN